MRWTYCSTRAPTRAVSVMRSEFGRACMASLEPECASSRCRSPIPPRPKSSSPTRAVGPRSNSLTQAPGWSRRCTWNEPIRRSMPTGGATGRLSLSPCRSTRNPLTQPPSRVDTPSSLGLHSPVPGRGAVAQLGERLNGIQEVDGSIPFGSTIRINDLRPAGWRVDLRLTSTLQAGFGDSGVGQGHSDHRSGVLLREVDPLSSHSMYWSFARLLISRSRFCSLQLFHLL